MNKFLKTFFLFFLLYSSVVMADDNGFFSGKDFDNNSFFNKKNSKKEVEKTRVNKVEKGEIRQDSFIKSSDKNKVIAISAIFNAHKIKETTKKLNDFYNFCVKYKIQPDTIYLKLPPFFDAYQEVLSKFYLISGDINYNVPEELKEIRKSPSYIIFVKDGYYVLNGVNNLKKFINSKGHFLSPRK